jgi:hypothetical protein
MHASLSSGLIAASVLPLSTLQQEAAVFSVFLSIRVKAVTAAMAVAILHSTPAGAVANDIPPEFQGDWGYISQDTDKCSAKEFGKSDSVFRIDARRIQELEHACEVLDVTIPMADDTIETQKRVDVRLRCSGEDATWEGSGSLVIQNAPSGPLLVAAMSDAKVKQDLSLGYKAPLQPVTISIARRCQK